MDLLAISAIGYLAASIAGLVTSGTGVSSASVAGVIELPKVNAETLPWFLGAIAALFILKSVFGMALTKWQALTLAKVEARAAFEIAKNALGNDLQTARHFSKPEVLQAVQGGSPAAFNGILNNFAAVVTEGVLLTALVSLFIFLNPILGITVVIYFAFVAWTIHFFVSRGLAKAAELLVKSSIDTDAAIANSFDVFREAYVTRSQDRLLAKILKTRLNHASSAADQIFLSGLPRYVIETSLLVGIAGLALFLSLSGNLVSSAIYISVFLTGGLRIIAALLPWQNALSSVRQYEPIAKLALDLLESEPKTIDEEWSPGTFSNLKISFKDVTYCYPESATPALKNVSIEIREGEFVSIIGKSGSGKSTLSDLIVGLVSPTQGAVEIGGTSARAVVQNYPGAVGYVPQRSGRITGTILENITLGMTPESIDFTRLDRALKMSNLEQLIQTLPEGLSTNLGKHTDNLSGGQLQRIGLARALYFDPKILVLDEATSALDENSESEIHKGLQQLKGHITIVAITHKLETVVQSDRVIVFENGQVLSHGTPSEMINQFRELD